MEPITLTYPPVAVLMLVGPSGSGKSTFAATHFLPTEVLASDEFRARVADDASAQHVTEDAFALLHFTLDLRLKHRRFTVVDSTALKPSARAQIIETANKRYVPVYALILDVPLEECIRRDARRTDRSVGEKVITRQYITFEQARRDLQKDKSLAGVQILTPETVHHAQIVRGSSAGSGNRFDIIGDVHGCYGELCELLNDLRYEWSNKDGLPRHPDGYIPVFVGDLADRGPNSPAVLKLATRLVAAGLALFAPGNHDDKLFRFLKGANVTRTHGLDLTIAQWQALPESERNTLTADILTYLATAPTHLVLDDDKLVVAHAGIRDEWIGQHHASVKSFTLYGDVRGFEPGTNKPIRHDWASEYAGSAFITYGHTPAPVLDWQTDEATGRRYVNLPIVNGTVNLDTGCVFGGALTAMRYPEHELYSVPARAIYAEHENLPYSLVK